MMEHLYPKTVKITTPETNNNNNDKKSAISIKNLHNERIKENKIMENSMDFDNKKINPEERHIDNDTQLRQVVEKSRPNKEDPSALISPQERILSNKNCVNLLNPLIVDEQHVTQPKKLKTESPAGPLSAGNFIEVRKEDDIVDLEARMQRERARILQGYSNSLGNAQRARDDQVLFFQNESDSSMDF